MAHREIINKIKEEQYDEEEGTATVSFDGKQFVIRIPTSVAEAAIVKKGDKVFFKAKIAPKPQPINKSIIEMKYVRKNG